VVLDTGSADTMGMIVKRSAALITTGRIGGGFRASARRRAAPPGANAAEVIPFHMRHVDPIRARRADSST
jgi:hypothetical protein